jgi:hypothetical protein
MAGAGRSAGLPGETRSGIRPVEREPPERAAVAFWPKS